MTGFENAANVAEETIDPSRAFPRALIGGMLTAGIVYVLVSIAAALAVPISDLAGNTLLEVIRADLFFIPASIMLVVFAVIAMIAISNTTLVTVVAQARILYGMAREDVVPAVFAKVHPTRRSPYVALLFGAAVVGALLDRRRGDPQQSVGSARRRTARHRRSARDDHRWCSCCSSTRS